MASLAVDLSGLGPRKSVVIVIIVVGCFSVLWPRIFQPMLMGYTEPQIMPNSLDKSSGCCDVIFNSDVNAVATVAQLCGEVLRLRGYNDTQHLSSAKASQICRAEVLSRCGLDVSAAFHSGTSGPDVKAVKRLMSEMRSVNGSGCLQVEFGVPPWAVGAGHRPRVNAVSDASIRQERPPHLRGDLPHPAMRERGRAIPATLRHMEALSVPPAVPQTPPPTPSPKIVEGRPAPIPGMRPPLGGAGHMTPAKTTSSPMGVLMPLYTIAIVIFFVYTLTKILFKKPQEPTIGPYNQMEPDPVFRKRVFGTESILNDPGHKKTTRGWTDDPKLGETELDQLRRRLLETERAMTRIVEQMGQVPLRTQDHIHTNGNIGNGSVHKQKKVASEKDEKPETSHQSKDEKATVKVLGMETTASCEGGQKWSRPSTPVLPPHRPPSRVEEAPVPQSIYLEGSLPHQSQLLVSESETHTETLPEQNGEVNDPPVVLSGKMTLSVINLDNPDSYEAQLDGDEEEEDNAEYEDDEELDEEIDLDNEMAAEEENQDLTDENVNEIEDEDIAQNNNGVSGDDDINYN